MTMVQYNVQVGANGSILIPTTPFAIGEEVEVVLRVPTEESCLSDDDWQPNLEAVRWLIENRRFAVDITDEEIEQLKHERRMKKML